MGKEHLLIVGLGNLPYPRSRHSIGQHIVHSIAGRWGMELQPVRGGDLAASRVLSVGGKPLKLSLFIPSALMNVCGRSVAKACSATVGMAEDMVVIHDSLEHKPLTLSPKFGGSAEGHNGVRSVITALAGNNKFHRLRVGIGRDDGMDVAKYVLAFLPKDQRLYWGPGGAGAELVIREILRIASKP
ncbi:peptidyl-tRNA hydrolase [Obba rivulosa]|uniref:peptidyl-tRNA hydrolase n=1 Tax=Obba rivulosa TaxID=1052685 RepID=A0A8E2J372_9APHY|nr:peptidyl-tRNA hydrolase [Obba rivulosa]